MSSFWSPWDVRAPFYRQGNSWHHLYRLGITRHTRHHFLTPARVHQLAILSIFFPSFFIPFLSFLFSNIRHLLPRDSPGNSLSQFRNHSLFTLPLSLFSLLILPMDGSSAIVDNPPCEEQRPPTDLPTIPDKGVRLAFQLAAFRSKNPSTPLITPHLISPLQAGTQHLGLLQPFVFL